MLKSFFLFSLLVSCSVFKPSHREPPVPDSLEAAIESDLRSEENTDRDEYQHPRETLEFFGLKPGMTVVEISPGAGYYTEILAPYLAREGQYLMAIPRLPPNPPAFLLENERKLQDILLRNTEVKEKTKFIPFEPLDERNRIKKEFADLVVSFSTFHNWIAKKETEMALKFSYDILKPGGVLGIVQHRVRAGKKPIRKSGYLTEAEVISRVEASGFKLLGKSEINANPKDTADYPEGVWVLPPVYRLGEKDRRRYERIGESDRMTLKFIKR